MKTDRNVVNAMQRDALYAYLELLNATKEVPRKEVYENILTLQDGNALDKVISFIESEYGKYDKYLEDLETFKNSSLFYRIFKFFKK